MYKKFMSYFGGAASYFSGAASKVGGGAKKKAKKQKTQQSNTHNPFGDFFKDIKTQTSGPRMATNEALEILNFQKGSIPTIAQIEKKYPL